MAATLPTFSRTRLRARLERLDAQAQLAFGASCCERLIPSYLAFQEEAGWGDVVILRKALNATWVSLVDLDLPASHAQTLLADCERIIPDSEDFDTLYASAAQDACLAVCSLMDFLLERDVDKIVDIAGFATDSVDLYVQEIEQIAPNTPDREERIRLHRLMQRELRKQEADLELLEAARVIDEAFLQALRASWDNMGRSNLDLPQAQIVQIR